MMVENDTVSQMLRQLVFVLTVVFSFSTVSCAAEKHSVSSQAEGQKLATLSASPAGRVVATLNKKQTEQFIALTAQRSARYQELLVFERVIREKREELGQSLKGLKREFAMDPEKSYSYDRAAKKLFEVSKAKNGKAVRKEVRAVQSEGESTYLSRLMVGRQLVERQLEVLMELVQEKQQEANLTDANLRKVFHLEANGIYRLDAAKGTILLTGMKQPASQEASAVNHGQTDKQVK